MLNKLNRSVLASASLGLILLSTAVPAAANGRVRRSPSRRGPVPYNGPVIIHMPLGSATGSPVRPRASSYYRQPSSAYRDYGRDSYYRRDLPRSRRHDRTIRNRTLVNPTIINSRIKDSVLIDPVIVTPPQYRRYYSPRNYLYYGSEGVQIQLGY